MKRYAAGLLIAGALFSSVPLSASAEGKHHASHKKVEYVALGDSITAGMTPYGGYDLSYPDFLKREFERSRYHIKDYDNFGVAGYTSEQLKNDVLTNENIRKEIKHATHITITIGANDLFRKLLTDPAHASEGIATASLNLQSILQTVDSLNRHASVYVMGYYNPFSYYDQDSQDFLVPLNNALNHEIEKATKANHDTFVPTAQAIDPQFEQYMPNPEDNHLNVNGYSVIAKEFWKAIKDKCR